jgi:hypothetical protein
MRGCSTLLYQDQKEMDGLLDAYAIPLDTEWFLDLTSIVPAQLLHDQTAFAQRNGEIAYPMQ